jgi:hypothetical protein
MSEDQLTVEPMIYRSALDQLNDLSEATTRVHDLKLKCLSASNIYGYRKLENVHDYLKDRHDQLGKELFADSVSDRFERTNSNFGYNTPQPPPTPSIHPATWDLVVEDMRTRDRVGTATYRTRLQPHNGRDSLTDAYQEILDAAAYLRNQLYERDGQ